ncbi:integral membrane protein [Niveomyces insectorum RCEF 264]|uniref:Integral membrane protein n=1 Tax=Niveomyces insectorum RCEF 264 TaxID=1081102 RepID=A0A167RBI4_9HYPO|nr:integral membrane protein [Niveomyces insectorum RCEF 264]
MSSAARSKLARAAAVAAVLAAMFAAASAVASADAPAPDDDVLQRFGPFGNGNGPFGNNNPFGNGNNNGNFGNRGPTNGANGNNGFLGLFGETLRRDMYFRNVHGILTSICIVILFPLGAILMRLLPGQLAVWAHAGFQTIAYLGFIAGACLGLYLVSIVTIPFGGGSLLTNATTNIHPIMGIVTLITLFFQPFFGFLHHARFRQLGRRTIWSYLHLWNGRIGITVGMVNGGLGLRLANASHGKKVAYIVVAVIMWFVWFLFAVVGEIRRSRNKVDPAVVPGRPTGPGYGAGGAYGPGGGGMFGRAGRTRQGSRNVRGSRSPGPGPQMTTADVGDRNTPSRPPRSGEHSPKVRDSHSRSSATPSRD